MSEDISVTSKRKCVDISEHIISKSEAEPDNWINDEDIFVEGK